MTSRVVVSVRVKATPDRAFTAFTQDIAIWWRDDAFFRLTPRSPGALAFEPPDPAGNGGRLLERLAGGRTFEVGRVKVWSPGERLVIGWRQATFGPNAATEVDIRFEAVGDQTRITVEHRGWESVPDEHVARHAHPFDRFMVRLADHWRSELAALAANLPHD